MRDLRILFMGTPDFAVTILERILKENYTVVGVVTAPDKPAGRGQKLHESAVKKASVKNDMEVLQPTNLKSEPFQQDLERLQPNLIMVVAFRMLPKKVWQFPEYGTFNLHASLLPQYRGAAPINWAIINGEQETGVTTFFIDEKIDTGEMILQEKLKIEKEDNAGILHDKLMHQGADLVIKTLEQIKTDNVQLKKQKIDGSIKTAYKLDKENTKIDWTKDTQTIYNLIRGLSPYPVAWCYVNNGKDQLRCKIYKASMQIQSHNEQLTSVSVIDKKLKVATKDGFIFVEEIQLPGKRKMNVMDLLNGFQLEKNVTMG